MKSLSKLAGFTLMLALLNVALVGASSAVTLQLAPSEQIPAAEGKAELRTNKNGNVQIKLTFRHLAPPQRVVPGANVFMVWVRGQEPDAAAQNLGALKVDKNLGAKMTAITALSSFDLFITCEPSQSVTVPASADGNPRQRSTSAAWPFPEPPAFAVFSPETSPTDTSCSRTPARSPCFTT